MRLWNQLWHDEHGFVLSAEAVLLGSVVVLGGIVGLKAAATSVNDELTEMASAIRSLDQSYVISGRSSCGAWTAGSYYIQPRVEDSLSGLCGEGAADVVGMRQDIDDQRNLIYPAESADRPPENELPPKKVAPKAKPLKKQEPRKSKSADQDE